MILNVTLPGHAQEEETPMVLDRSALTELLEALKAGGDIDFLPGDGGGVPAADRTGGHR